MISQPRSPSAYITYTKYNELLSHRDGAVLLKVLRPSGGFLSSRSPCAPYPIAEASRGDPNESLELWDLDLTDWGESNLLSLSVIMKGGAAVSQVCFSY
ncbi:hypothetical protein EYF80_062694 [Liparis tanakae]|uniref:Uncharacterized protein n=1 Tax=Liparis tanakae TaxID=230148 RepID=A0A4Z2EEK5_9TELE|nr:hypothetical protein EYF80_062694 [Liparis tanakae]